MSKVVDDVQKCVNLIEALNDAQQDAKNFRTHSHRINASVQLLLPAILQAQRKNPSLLQADGAGATFHKLNSIMEEAIMLMRKTATLSQLDKLFDQGDTKRRLDDILEIILQATQEMNAFLFFQERLEHQDLNNPNLQNYAEIVPRNSVSVTKSATYESVDEASVSQSSRRDNNLVSQMIKQTTSSQVVTGDSNLIPGFSVEHPQQHPATHENKSWTNVPDLLTGDDPIPDSINTLETNMFFPS